MTQSLNTQSVARQAPRPAARAAHAANEAPTRPPERPSGPPRLPNLETEQEATEVRTEVIELDDEGALTDEEDAGPDDSATIVASRAALERALASCTSVDAAESAAESPPGARTTTSKPPPLPIRASLLPKPSAGARLPAQSPSAIASGRDEVRALVRAAQGALDELGHMLREIERRLEDPSKWTAATASPPALPNAAHPLLGAPSNDKKQRPRAVYAAAVSLALGLGALVLALVCTQSC